MDLAAYRSSAEAFVSGLTGAYYRHYAGLDDEFEIEPIYDAHAELFERSAVETLRELAAAAGDGTDERRRLALLLDFATDGYLGAATKAVEAELARREARATIEFDGAPVGLRESAVLQANEPDAARRAAIEDARLAVTETELGDLHRELIETQHAEARTLGYGSYRELCELTKGLDLAGLKAQTAAFSAATETAYPELLEPQLQRVLGLSLGELRRADLPRFFRAPDDDVHFPAARLVESLTDTLEALGVAGRPGAILDVEQRPKKSPRAFCAPVRVPDEVYLVIAPVGGRDDFSALFHEAGHTEHYAHVDADAGVRVPLPRRQRDHRVVRVPAPARDRGPRVARAPAGRRGPERAARLRPCPPPDLPAPVRGQARLRARAARPGARGSTSSRAATPSCSAARCGCDGRPRPTCPTSTPASTAPATCAPGRSRPTCARTCGLSTAKRGSSRRPPARRCASCGARASE